MRRGWEEIDMQKGKNVEGSLDRDATRMDERRCSRGRRKAVGRRRRKEMERRLNRRRGQREREVEWGNKERKKKRGQERKRRGKEME